MKRLNKLPMVIKALLLFIGIATTHNSLSQNYKAVYRLEYVKDTLNKKEKKHEDFILFLNDNKSSYFIGEKHMYNDSLMMMVHNGMLSKNDFLTKSQNLKSTRFNFFVLKDAGITVIDKIYTSYFRYSVTESLKWSIADKDSNILGYTCHLATTYYAGRKYNAWFTPEIPIADGPYIFAGLPGLILNIHDNQTHYNFDIISLNEFAKGTIPDFLFVKKAKPAQRAKVLDLGKEYRANMVDFVKRNHGIRFVSKEDEDLVKKKSSKNNNSIELEW